MRKKRKLKDLLPEQEFYWNRTMCFWGKVLEQLPNNNTKILDGGMDGNEYLEYTADGNEKVWIEVE